MTFYMLSYEEKERLRVIDSMLANGSETLDKLIEAEKIIQRLQGTPEIKTGPILGLIEAHNSLSTDFQNLRNEVWNMKTDLSALVRAVNDLHKPVFSNDLQNLKSKHGIY